MNKKKKEALTQLKAEEAERKRMQEQLNEMNRKSKGTVEILLKESGREYLENLGAIQEALLPGGSFHRLLDAARDSIKEMAEYDPNYLKELTKQEPYGIKVDDGAKYLRGLLGGFWKPETEFYVVLGKKSLQV